MNKQKKQFVVVVILMAVCIIGYFGVGKFYKNQEEKESENKEATAITAFELKDYEKITAFNYIANGTSITLTKDSDGKWHDSSDASVNISKDSVETDMLAKLVSVTAYEKIAKKDDISQYGFTIDDNGNVIAETNTIALTDEDNTTYTLYIGKENPYDTSKYYMMVEGDDNIYLVDSDIQTAFSKNVSDITETTTEAATQESTEAQTEEITDEAEARTN